MSIRCENGIWVIDGDDWISRWVCEGKRLDHDCWLLGEVEKRLSGRRRTCLDIGAYIGDHTVRYAGLFKLVVAFEPNPEAYECLNRNLADSSNVVCLNGAVGVYATGRMVLDKRNPGASRVDTVMGGDVCFINPCGIPDVDFIKIDVEGMEPDVLEECRPLIERYGPQMLIEQRACDGNEEHVLEMLAGMGYRAESIQGHKGEQYDLWCERG